MAHGSQAGRSAPDPAAHVGAAEGARDGAHVPPGCTVLSSITKPAKCKSSSAANSILTDVALVASSVGPSTPLSVYSGGWLASSPA
jgi:hypothetical protein